MREQTLKHLLLLTGKSLSENDDNVEIVHRIEEVCRTLSITREKRSPFNLKWKEDDVEREMSIDDGQFSFHVRGDVPDRNPNNEDMRSKNWNAACAVWSKILGVGIQSNSSTLAPQFILEATRPRVLNTIRITFGLIALIVAFSFDTETAMTLLGVLACNEGLKIGDKAIRREAGLTLFGITLIAATAISAGSTPAFLGMVLLELVTAFLVFTYREVFVLLLAAILTLWIGVASSDLAISWAPSRVVGFLSFFILAVLTLPLGKSGNLRRISVPISLALCFLCANLSPVALWATAIFMAINLNPLEIRRPKLFVKRDDLTVTPVAIRQSRGL